MNRHELIQLLGYANEFKEGDLAIGVGTADDKLRAAARRDLSRVRLADIFGCDLVEDGLTEAFNAAFVKDRRCHAAYNRMKKETVGGIRDSILAGCPQKPVFSKKTGFSSLRAIADGMTSEMIAAVAKVMTNEQLVRASASLFNPLSGAGSVGAPECLGSRIQPNSPTDDATEILYSIFEGLSYGCGDVIIGLNPANDSVDEVIELENLLATAVERLQLPTRWAVLSDMRKQREAQSRGAKVDVGFQSLAGTSKAMNGMLGCDVGELRELCGTFGGLYFETGQGSEFTNGADGGIDMVTLESRTYGLARLLRQKTGKWTIVNDVAGFIGPEVFKTPEQLLRACFEDLFMGKMHGLAMGLDVCSTYHMGIPPEVLDELTEQVAFAAPAYFMALAGKSDPMLGYLTTDFRMHPRLRQISGKSVTTAFKRRLMELGVMRPDGRLTDSAGDLMPIARALGESRSNRTVAQLCDSTPPRPLGQTEPNRTLAQVWNSARPRAFGESARNRTPSKVCNFGPPAVLGKGTRRATLSQLSDPTLTSRFGETTASVRRTVRRLQDRGFDIGYGYEKDFRAPGPVQMRLDEVFKHARRALYRTITPGTMRTASRTFLRVRTASATRDEFIGRPFTGERLDDASIRAIRALYASGKMPEAQIVVSDGLNADAVNENLPDLLPPLRPQLGKLGLSCGKDIYVANGRVRAGYHIGQILNAPLVIHLIGERPGTGTNNLSAYITYGLSPEGASLWPGIEHSNTTALCSINKHVGVRPADAAVRIARLAASMMKHRCSGVALIPFLQTTEPSWMR
ncbi:MAG: ethanolamine ammonia-lyase [Planctomycetes bacterium]|nr:ethanolamine ammonia-lyase [Planctomycetota bacterium]